MTVYESERSRNYAPAVGPQPDSSLRLSEFIQDLFASGFRKITFLDTCSINEAFFKSQGFTLSRDPGDVWQVCWTEAEALTTTMIDSLPGGTIIVTRTQCDVRECKGLIEYPIFVPPDHLKVYAIPRRINVIVPVHNALQDTLACIESLKECDDKDPLLDVQYTFIDDASPDADVIPKIRENLPIEWTLLSNETNLGFPSTVNKGISRDVLADIVMLNSDVCVTQGWLRRLAQTAGESDDIGTVTAMSQEASMYSWPPLSHTKIDYKEAAQAFADSHEIGPYQIPVGVGFCMYVKRSVIEKHGMLDTDFGRGYGEDTDYCLRLQKNGLRNLMEPRAYVRHVGGASMSEVYGDLRVGNTVRENEDKVHKRWPSFQQQVKNFFRLRCGAEATKLDRAFLKYTFKNRRRILVITHNPLGIGHVGGVEFHAHETISDLNDDYVFVAIAPKFEFWHARAHANGVSHRFEPGDLNSPESFALLLDDLQPDLIHVQHTIGLPQNFLPAVTSRSIPIVLSVHDYILACPRYNLMDAQGSYCGFEPLSSEKHSDCLNALSSYSGDLPTWRHRSQELLDAATKVVFVSQDVLQRHRAIFKLPSHTVIPCGVAEEDKSDLDDELKDKINSVTQHVDGQTTKPIHVCILGAGREDKGTALVTDTVNDWNEDGVVITILGADQNQFPEIERNNNVFFAGKYKSTQVLSALRELGPDVVCLVSPWPETYSRTLSEAWLAGIPAIVSNLGAPSDRVRESGAGWVLSELTPHALRSLILHLKDNPAEIEKKRELTANAHAPFSREVSAQISEIYRQIIPEPRRLQVAPRLPFDFSVQFVHPRQQIARPEPEPESEPPPPPAKPVFPNTRLGHFAKFVTMIAFRVHDVGIAKTLARPLGKVYRKLVPIITLRKWTA